MSKRKNSSRIAFLLVIFCSWWTVASSTTTSSSSSNFEPYQLNGGLVTAVAGPDYLLVAADTRLMQGYQILTRHDTTRIRVIRNDNDDTTTPTISTPTSTPVHPNKVPWSNKDGTLNVDVDRVTSQRKTILETGTFTASSSSPSILSILASAGCQADVQALHLQLRSQLRQGSAWSETSTCHNLLSQILYSRRGFPFYSFCVLAEWNNNNNNNNIGGPATNHVACPKVFVYDAIGSYEQVAVATAGTGRELLQPILDQQFSSLLVLHNNPNDDSVVASSSCGVVHASKEECMNIISRAYRSVAEREIGVGDALLILVIQRGKKKNHEDDPNFLLEWTLSCEPLKSH